MPGETAFTAFLSHKYKAPVVNEFFFRLFSETAQVQFEVDSGGFATNVTRLERLVRDADAFVGIYPFDESGAGNQTKEELAKNSRYFRLELDIAARARKPGLVFKDDRFRGIFSAPAPIQEVGFDIKEIVGLGEKPSSPKFRKEFRSLTDRVQAARSYALIEERPSTDRTSVGLLLPPVDYRPEHLETVQNALLDARYDPVPLPWPPVVTPNWIRRIRELEWIIVDVGPRAAATGIVGFLHGAFLPALRLRFMEQEGHDLSTDEALYSGVEVGYAKDIVQWRDANSLAEGLKQRISSLEVERQRISTLDDALKYFRSAALRKEAVFVSYSGTDRDAASPLLAAIGKRFQRVFDYRDGQSIRPGSPG